MPEQAQVTSAHDLKDVKAPDVLEALLKVGSGVADWGKPGPSELLSRLVTLNRTQTVTESCSEILKKGYTALWNLKNNRPRRLGDPRVSLILRAMEWGGTALIPHHGRSPTVRGWSRWSRLWMPWNL